MGFHLREVSRTGKSIETESRLVVASGGCRMTDERGQGFLWGDDDGLEPDNDTGCMPLSMYEKPLYCTLLTDLNGQFYAK